MKKTFFFTATTLLAGLTLAAGALAAGQSETDQTLQQRESTQMQGVGQQDQQFQQGQQLSSEQVRQVQQQLQAQGIDPGPIDGIMGPKTSSAIEQYQQQQGIAATGQPNQQTLQSLGVQSGSDQEFMGVSPTFPAEREPQEGGSIDQGGSLEQERGLEREGMEQERSLQPGSSGSPESGTGMGR